MTRYITLLAIAAAITFSSCRHRTVHYYCQCRVNGTYTAYPIGQVPGDQAQPRCYTVQQQNGMDTCDASGVLEY